MKKIVQAIPNFSEGRDLEKVNRIINSVRDMDNVKIIDHSSDKNHNRSVLTLLGEIDQISLALIKLAKAVFVEIDMTKHQGEHPRMGALDVVPIVPIMGVEMSECIEYSNFVAKEISKLGAVVYLYEYSSKIKDRKNLSIIRRGQYEGFFNKINEEFWTPDYGSKSINPKIGVTAVGARDPLIAFNVNLSTNDISIANNIAKNIRNINGGLRFVKAIGIYLKDRDIAQVSMNLVNYKGTSIYQAIEMIRFEAKRYGVNIIGSELIGAMTIDALLDSAKYYLQLEDIKNEQILEYNLLGD